MSLPNHIAIILDGNGRWAQAKGMPRSYGHVAGCDNLEHMCDYIRDIGVKYLTVYAFSTENWKRSEDEVRVLMNLFRRYLRRVAKKAVKNEMRVRIIGDKEGLAPDIRKIMEDLEELSKDYDKMYFQMAINYGGRDEILRAVEKIAADVRAGSFIDGKPDEKTFEKYLDTADIPDPDLLIRTSGEMRISNFLPWQIAYSEFYFTDVPWPDFHEEELEEAIRAYENRDRRFGNAHAKETN